ncbi:hypothetical protein QFC21_005888 [Naganishia friedmannii]|uniref:Uncharacterized protein n=1 Tax=Naganishia friedmannii TaxID=89922 RepID=A0ACC2V6J8_9TREE|nr:hypothetical protein QFC21_005888 [Naganishia friedmannii]
MALSWIFPRVFTPPAPITADGAYAYFDGNLLHYDVERAPDKYVSKFIFKAGNKYTGNGRSSTATPPYHYHVYQDEHFEVVSGTMGYLVNGKQGILHKGESLKSPAGDRHTIWCPANAKEDLEVLVTTSGPGGPG